MYTLACLKWGIFTYLTKHYREVGESMQVLIPTYAMIQEQKLQNLKNDQHFSTII